MSESSLRSPLPEGSSIVLTSGENHFPITVGPVIGLGGSCIVYRATEETVAGSTPFHRPVILKEFCPCDLALPRLADGSLTIPPENTEIFRLRQAQYTDAQLRQIVFASRHQGLSLPAPHIIGNFGGTTYAVSDLGEGQVLTQLDRSQLTLWDAAALMEAVCQAILPFHIRQELYLDCKPDNIFVRRSNGSWQVALFDFDTVVSLSDIRARRNRFCSYSQRWAAPEQIPRTGETGYARPLLLGFHTDIFALGLLFYWLLTGMEPPADPTERGKLLERIRTGAMDWAALSPLCRNASPQALEQVEILMQRMLEADPKVRAKTFSHPSYLTQEVCRPLQDLQTFTLGGDSLHASIHEEIHATDVHVEQANDTLDKVQNTLENVSRRGKRTFALVLCALILVLAIGGGLWFHHASGSEESALDPNAQQHILFQLSNANHRYEVGLENWRRMDLPLAYEAISEAREEIIEVSSPAELDTARVNNSLGCLCLDMGRYSEAYEYLQDAQVTFRDVCGASSTEARSVKFAIAQYDYLTGDFEQAMQTTQEILDGAEERTDRVLLTAVNHLRGAIAEARGDLPGALASYEAALALYDEFLSDDALVGELADYTQGASLAENQRQELTAAVRWILRTYGHLGRVHLALGHTEKARELLLSAIDMANKNVYIGTENLVVAQLHMTLAQTGTSEGVYPLEEIDLAMRIEQKLFGYTTDYPGLAEVYAVYGDLLWADGQTEAAGEKYSQAVENAEALYGHNHPQTAMAYNARGLFELKNGDAAAAETSFQTAVDIQRALLHRAHPDTAAYYLHLAESQEKLGHAQAANESRAQAQRIQDQLAGTI